MSGLALFFTRGVALTTWRDIGSMERECRMYQHLARQLGHDVVFVTYGGREDRALGRSLDGVRVLANTWGLPRRFYLRKLGLPLQGLGGVSVVKTNQFNGSEEALGVARELGKRFVCRCGYFPSTKVGWEHGFDSPRAQEARKREEAVFQASDLISVTTGAMRERIVRALPELDATRVHVVPNFVDIDQFSPAPTESDEGRRSEHRLIYVGRFESEKNVLALVDAVAELDVELWLVGSGSQAEEILARPANKAKVRLLGSVANHRLPALLRQATAFVLPSHFEHHPKALLEAMSCGLPCIGSDVFGIRGLLRDGENGLLGGPDPADLRASIERLLADRDLRQRLGAAARASVVETYSFAAVARREEAMLRAAGLDFGNPA